MKLLRDAFLITLIMFVVMFGLSNIPLQFETFNPIQNVFKDFDITDIVFSQLKKDPKLDDKIVVVNIGKLDRGEIGQLLEKIATQKPKVVGIDAFFRKLRDDKSDTLLQKGIEACKNVVFVSQLQGFNDKTKQYDTLNITNPFFSGKMINSYANLTTTGDENMSEFLTCRSFIPQTKCKGKNEVAFAVKLAEIYDKNKAKKFLARKNVSEYINYRGNIKTGKNAENVYTSVDFSQVLNDEVENDVFTNRIVLLGFMGNSLQENSFDDKFYTPLNKNYVGKSTPDMYGIVVHANIISMILNQDYIDEMNEYMNIFLAIVLIFSSVLLFSFFYNRIGFWFDSVTLVMQFVFAILLFTINIYAFYTFNLRVNINLALAGAVLSGLMVEFYYGLFVKLYEKTKKQPTKEIVNNL
ncbi:MAG: CHASE2 domain-containing protein [Bacteroidetes bacterium]|nr:MAG: CHASE2 domain-containing protein [Bacteroidota bacterium]TAG90301.1 MAG: CHASE2 domain-containing protein [Bacteroidota bacterium]